MSLGSVMNPHIRHRYLYGPQALIGSLPRAGAAETAGLHIIARGYSVSIFGAVSSPEEASLVRRTHKHNHYHGVLSTDSPSDALQRSNYGTSRYRRSNVSQAPDPPRE